MSCVFSHDDLWTQNIMDDIFTEKMRIACAHVAVTVALLSHLLQVGRFGLHFNIYIL